MVSGKQWQIFILGLVFPLTFTTVTGAAAQPAGKTLSPYFSIESGQEGSELLPLTTTSVGDTQRHPGGDALDVVHPLPMPRGVSNLAIGGGQRVPEPGLLFMGALICLAVLAKWVRRKSGWRVD